MKRTILLSVIAVLVAVAARAQDMPDHLIKLMYTGNVISNFYVDAPDNDAELALYVKTQVSLHDLCKAKQHL